MKRVTGIGGIFFKALITNRHELAQIKRLPPQKAEVRKIRTTIHESCRSLRKCFVGKGVIRQTRQMTLNWDGSLPS